MKITLEMLRKLEYEILAALGVSEEDAKIGAATLNRAEARGVDSHGISMLEQLYLPLAKAGVIDPKAVAAIENETQSIAVMNGHNGFGVITAPKGMLLAIDKAKKTGIGAVSVKESGHFGVAAHFSMLAAEQGLVGIAISNTVCCMIPFGGKDPVLGNSPWSVAFPACSKYPNPIVMDLAMSVGTNGKVLMLKRNGKPLPTSWAVDADGLPTDDIDYVLHEPRLQPVGGPKGYCIGIMWELICAAVSGGAFGRTIGTYSLRPNAGPPRPERVCHMFIALDISKFRPLEDISETVDDFVEMIKNCEPAKGVDEILLPGEIENRITLERQSGFFEMNQDVIEAALRAAKAVGLVDARCTAEELFKQRN